jgi:hypothetical protein
MGETRRSRVCQCSDGGVAGHVSLTLWMDGWYMRGIPAGGTLHPYTPAMRLVRQAHRLQEKADRCVLGAVYSRAAGTWQCVRERCADLCPAASTQGGVRMRCCLGIGPTLRTAIIWCAGVIACAERTAEAAQDRAQQGALCGIERGPWGSSNFMVHSPGGTGCSSCDVFDEAPAQSSSPPRVSAAALAGLGGAQLQSRLRCRLLACGACRAPGIRSAASSRACHPGWGGCNFGAVDGWPHSKTCSRGVPATPRQLPGVRGEPPRNFETHTELSSLTNGHRRREVGSGSLRGTTLHYLLRQTT